MNFAKWKTKLNEQPFCQNFACLDKAENMLNSVVNHFAKRKRNPYFDRYHCVTKSKQNSISYNFAE
jgi:hypothetical protein